MQTVNTLQSDQQFTLADEVQRILNVGQSLKTALGEQHTENRRLQDEIKDAVGKVAAAFEISQNDQDTIERLKLEIENSWRQTDAAHVREQSAQELVLEMRIKLEQMQVEIKKTAKKDTVDE